MIFISINVEVKLESIAFEEKNQMLITIIYIYIYLSNFRIFTVL